MTPCSACARHVKHDETACPFCGAPFIAPAPRNARVVGRVTRAAIFSAALVACGKHEDPKPTPKPGSAEHLDQDFNQLLGSAEVQQAPADAAVALASDAAVDAGLSDEERTRQLQHAQDQQRQQQQQQQQQQQRQHADDERRRRELEQERLREQQDMMHNAKPYGAPPARRRVV
jgi:hypothetical protein